MTSTGQGHLDCQDIRAMQEQVKNLQQYTSILSAQLQSMANVQCPYPPAQQQRCGTRVEPYYAEAGTEMPSTFDPNSAWPSYGE